MGSLARDMSFKGTNVTNLHAWVLDLKHFLFAIALTLQLVPCVSFSLTDFEIQPFAFLTSLFCLALTRWYLPKTLWLLLIPPMACFSLIWIGDFDIALAARSFVTYLTPFVIAACTYQTIKAGVNVERYIRIMMWVWCFVGTAQWLIDPYVFNFLVHAREGSGGGVAGLAPEPSFYGLSVILMWLLLYYLHPSVAMSWRYLLLLVFQVFVLSASALASSIVILSLAVWLVLNCKKISILVAVILGTGLYLFHLSMIGMIDVRTLFLLEKLIESPADVLLLDGSVSERIFHIYLSLSHSVSDFLTPHGIYSFSDVIVEGQRTFSYFWIGDASNKIMSGFGAALYELGVFSLTYFFVTVRALLSQKAFSSGNKVFIAFVLFACYFNSVTLAAPYFGILLGSMAAKQWLRKQGAKLPQLVVDQDGTAAAPA